jgi:hypothetical protein
LKDLPAKNFIVVKEEKSGIDLADNFDGIEDIVGPESMHQVKRTG